MMMYRRYQRYQLFLVFLLFLLCLSYLPLAQANDDTAAYTRYAETQQAQVAQKIAPYGAEIAEIQAIAQRTYQESSPIMTDQSQQISGFTASHHAQNPDIATPGDIFIFISFSMPEANLRQWFEQAARFHATCIVRGLVNGSFDQTQISMARLSGEDKGGVVLEPRLFSDYQVTQVPAVVVRNTAITCPITQNCPHVYPFDVVVGDVGLEEALSVIARQTDGAATEVAKEALAWRDNR